MHPKKQLLRFYLSTAVGFGPEGQIRRSLRSYNQKAKQTRPLAISQWVLYRIGGDQVRKEAEAAMLGLNLNSPSTYLSIQSN
jgi:hypothetical protein